MLRHGTSSDNDQTQHAALVEATLDGAQLRYVRRFDHWEGGVFNARISTSSQALLAGRPLARLRDERRGDRRIRRLFTLDLATGKRVQVTRTRNLDGWSAWCRG